MIGVKSKYICLVFSFSSLSEFNNSDSLISKEPVHYAPIAATGSFALELYFKSIRQSEQGNFESGYELVVLFSLLSETAQHKIKNLYPEKWDDNPIIRKCFSDDELEFNKVLSNANKSFVDFRYFFQDNHNDYELIADVLKATRDYIIELNPNWKQLL